MINSLPRRISSNASLPVSISPHFWTTIEQVEIFAHNMNAEDQKTIVRSHGHLVSHKSAHQTSLKSKFSAEDSGPPSPSSGPVNNFGEVAPGIYRSSFPQAGNMEHVSSLGLKSIL